MRMPWGLRMKWGGEPFSCEEKQCFPPTQTQHTANDFIHLYYLWNNLTQSLGCPGATYSFCKATYKMKLNNEVLNIRTSWRPAPPRITGIPQNFTVEISHFSFQFTRSTPWYFVLLQSFFPEKISRHYMEVNQPSFKTCFVKGLISFSASQKTYSDLIYEVWIFCPGVIS